MKTLSRKVWGTCRLGMFLAMLMPVLAEAQFTFTTNNGAITITGYTGPGGNVVIPSSTNGYPVTSIGDNAFFLSGITNVIIPNSVTNIGYNTFDQCYGLTSVTIPNSVTTIGYYAFKSCGLASVTIGNGVISIGSGAFAGCNLTSVTIPNSVTSIGSNAFNYCYMLTNVVIGSGVTSIGTDALAECWQLSSIAVSPANRNYASLGGALFDKSLETLIRYPANLPGDYSIPNSVTAITDGAFRRCIGLTSVIIPNSVRSIGSETFFCSALTNVIIPNNLTNIGNLAFYCCGGLTSVRIPNSVTRIGDEAFGNCYGLTCMFIPSGVTTISSGMFEYCSGLTNLTIGNAVTAIRSNAFANCNGLKSILIPNTVISIGDFAFASCFGLESVFIPNSITNIGVYAFGYCYNLNQIYFQGNAPLINGTEGSADNTMFSCEYGTVFYSPGATGWRSTFGGWPTAQWYQPQPQILGSGYGLGLQNNQFNFTISWATNISVVVEGSTNLVNWTAIATNALVNGTNAFSDSNYINFPRRFYRVRSQ